MENNLVNFKPDNNSSIENNEALILIKSFFKNNLPQFELAEEYNSHSNYTGFRISYRKSTDFIEFSCSWRGVEHNLFIDGQLYSLISFEPALGGILSCSKINLTQTLSVLKLFIDKKNDNSFI